MRLLGGLAVVVGAFLAPGMASQAQKPAELAERMHQAESKSALDVDGLKPWHLKIAVSLFDDKGRPKEQGTVEEWWNAPHLRKLVFATPSYSMTEVENSEGLFRTKGAGVPPLMLGVLLDQVVHPLPPAEEVDEAEPEFRKETFGKVALDCIMLSEPIKSVTVLPLGLFPTYCFDPGGEALRISYNYGSQYVLRNGTGTFQSRTVAIDTTVKLYGVVAANGHVQALGAAPPIDLSNVDGLESTSDRAAKVSGGMMQGMLITKVSPIYPEVAKVRRAHGTVLIRAIIGRDGRIRFMKLITVVDPDLAVAALTAVRQWVYKPFLLNNEPTEVDTTISVNFNLGPG